MEEELSSSTNKNGLLKKYYYTLPPRVLDGYKGDRYEGLTLYTAAAIGIAEYMKEYIQQFY